jgi:hypothetical protein
MLRKAWTVFAEAFFVEAREVGIDARRFSVPSFLDYIANQGAIATPLNSSGTPQGDPNQGNVQLEQNAIGSIQNCPAANHSNI